MSKAQGSKTKRLPADSTSPKRRTYLLVGQVGYGAGDKVRRLRSNEPAYSTSEGGNMIATIIICLALVILVGGIVYKIIKNKKEGKSSCSCGCGSCDACKK